VDFDGKFNQIKAVKTFDKYFDGKTNFLTEHYAQKSQQGNDQWRINLNRLSVKILKFFYKIKKL